jgi:hypothetical protein
MGYHVKELDKGLQKYEMGSLLLDMHKRLKQDDRVLWEEGTTKSQK